MLRRFGLTLLLLALCPSLSYSAEVTHVPAGWITPEQGYFLTEQAGRDVLSALQSRREESEAWQSAYSDLRTEFLTTSSELREQIMAVQDSISEERKAWQAELRQARGQNILWLLVAVGAGYAVGR